MFVMGAANLRCNEVRWSQAIAGSSELDGGKSPAFNGLRPHVSARLRELRFMFGLNVSAVCGVHVPCNGEVWCAVRV
ncbi:MAG: hypothetical protein ACI8QS_003608 [Planctomycetota bacterium]|jgi:hypothetical protein